MGEAPEETLHIACANGERLLRYLARDRKQLLSSEGTAALEEAIASLQSLLRELDKEFSRQ